MIKNIKKLNRLKLKYNKDFPKLTWQFVVMNHNENQVFEAKFMARELGMNILFKHTWDNDYVPNNPVMLKQETGIDFERKEKLEHHDTKVFGNHPCRQCFLEPRVNFDGRLLGCCVLFKETFKDANVFKQGLRAALQTPQFVAAKKILMGQNKDNHEDTPCDRCAFFRAIVSNENYIVPANII